MTFENAVKHFHRHPVRDFRWEAFYKGGSKVWQASCQFEVKVELDPEMPALDRSTIEYRQYIRGGVWVRRGTEDWTANSEPNGNGHFKIPPYAGQAKVPELPMAAVHDEGLSLRWKEDGEKEHAGAIERYGYRDNLGVDTANESDIWRPENTAGPSYFMRDTPSIMGDWGEGKSVDVWIELHFRGCVVVVEPDDHYVTQPVQVLDERRWNYFWHPPVLDLWSNAFRLKDVD